MPPAMMGSRSLRPAHHAEVADSHPAPATTNHHVRDPIADGGRAVILWGRSSSWLEVTSACGALTAPLVRRNAVSAPGTDGLIPVLARTAGEVEAAAQRGRVLPSDRTRFQVVAVLARQERARVRAEISSDARRSVMLKRLDGIALILAQIATRDTSLLALLAEDAVLSDAARALDAEPVAGRREGGGRSRGHGPGAAGRRSPPPPPSGGWCRRRSSRVSWPTRSSPRTSPPSGRARPRRVAWPPGSCSGRCSARSSGPAGEPRRAWRCPRRRRCRRRAAAH